MVSAGKLLRRRPQQAVGDFLGVCMAGQVPVVDYLQLGDSPHLVATECTKCGARYFDRRNACASCFATEFRSVPVATEGEVRAFTQGHARALGDLAAMGFRFALEEVTDLDMDFAALRETGFAFVELDAPVFLDGLPASDLPPVADLAIVDDGSAITGEVMNLLARRNLLFEVAQAPVPRFRVNIVMGSAAYPREEAADPSAFAQKIRGQLTDEQRTLRVYGSEVVICRLTGDGQRMRLHLLNYGGRDIEGLRIRVRGTYRSGDAYVAGAGRLPLADQTVADGATEFSLPRIATYAVIDLK